MVTITAKESDEIYAKLPEVADTDWSSPDQILYILRNIRTGNRKRLAKHSFARSSIVRQRLELRGLPANSNSIALAIIEVIESVVVDGLNKARSLSPQNYKEPVGRGYVPSNDSISMDAASRNLDLKGWSLLAHHYLWGYSIAKLSQQFSYSLRDIHYHLRKTIDRLSKILISMDNIEKSASGELLDCQEMAQLSPNEKESLLNLMDIVYSAPCSAYLWGDWSISVSKKAIIVPINKRVTVGIKFNPAGLQCRMFGWSANEGKWILSERESANKTAELGNAWNCLTSRFKLSPADIYVFCDSHFGYGIWEASAICVALAGCISNLKENLIPRMSTEQMAAIIESFIYPKVIGGSLLCSSQAPNKPSVMFFDRTQDGGIDFGRLASGDPEEMEKNRAMDIRQFRTEWLDFDVTKLMVLTHRPASSTLGNTQKVLVDKFHLLRPIGFDHLCDVMRESITNQDYEKTGALMNLHQDLLSLSGFFSKPLLEGKLDGLRSTPGILGIKPCCRATGAYLSLLNDDPDEVRNHLPSWITAMCTFVHPTPGLTRLKPA